MEEQQRAQEYTPAPKISTGFSYRFDLVNRYVESNLDEANDHLGAGTQLLHRCRKILESGVFNVFLLYVMFSFCLLLMHWIYE